MTIRDMIAWCVKDYLVDQNIILNDIQLDAAIDGVVHWFENGIVDAISDSVTASKEA